MQKDALREVLGLSFSKWPQICHLDVLDSRRDGRSIRGWEGQE